MHPFNPRHQFYLCRRKVGLFFLGIVLLGYTASGQNSPSENLINYDDQWIHFGFLFSGHSSKYVIRYSDAFTLASQDTVHSIIPGNLGGFKLGFVLDIKLLQYLHFRALPTVGFYEHDLTYRFTNLASLRELKDATMVELPLLLKYKSARRGNLAMYTIFGINPSLEAAGKGDEQNTLKTLELKNWNVAFEVGAGLDMYFQYFKFSPEIRYSFGLRNLLADEPNDFSVGLRRLTTQNLGIFLTFEGGPHNKKRGKKGKADSTSKKLEKRQKKRLGK